MKRPLADKRPFGPFMRASGSIEVFNNMGNSIPDPGGEVALKVTFKDTVQYDPQKTFFFEDALKDDIRRSRELRGNYTYTGIEPIRLEEVSDGYTYEGVIVLLEGGMLARGDEDVFEDVINSDLNIANIDTEVENVEFDL